MRNIVRASTTFFAEILHDFMLLACLLAPVLMGLVFRLGLPLLEALLCAHFGAAQLLASYYLLFDLLLAVMTPMMFAFSGVMVMLSELDNGTARYLAVTPLGKRGYLLSRLGIPTAVAVLYDAVLLSLFANSALGLLQRLVFAAAGGGMGIITAMLVVCFAKNKVEGMALTKLSGLLILGLPAAFFVEAPLRYLAGILPSFWLAQAAVTGMGFHLLLLLLTLLAWILLLYRRFQQKLL